MCSHRGALGDDSQSSDGLDWVEYSRAALDGRMNRVRWTCGGGETWA